jgi:putative membrane protein
MSKDDSARSGKRSRGSRSVRHLLKGVGIGMADPIPGVSAGTIAYIVGVYERAVLAIRRFRRGGWQRNLGLLLPIAAGMLLGIFAVASLVELLLEAFPNLIRQVFTGLILGGLWVIVKEEDLPLDRRTVPAGLFAAALLAVLLAFLPHPGPPEADPIRDPTVGQAGFVFGAGVFASAGMVVPGLSGAVLQIVIGSYSTYVAAVRELNLLILVLFYMGALVGIAGMANLLGALFERYYLATHTLIGGLVLGSAVFVWPFEAGWTVQLTGLPAAVAAALIPALLGRLGSRWADEGEGTP